MSLMTRWFSVTARPTAEHPDQPHLCNSDRTGRLMLAADRAMPYRGTCLIGGGWAADGLHIAVLWPGLAICVCRAN